MLGIEPKPDQHGNDVRKKKERGVVCHGGSVNDSLPAVHEAVSLCLGTVMLAILPTFAEAVRVVAGTAQLHQVERT